MMIKFVFLKRKRKCNLMINIKHTKCSSKTHRKVYMKFQLINISNAENIFLHHLHYINFVLEWHILVKNVFDGFSTFELYLTSRWINYDFNVFKRHTVKYFSITAPKWEMYNSHSCQFKEMKYPRNIL